MQTKFNFYSDPSHGWVEVPLQLLKDLDIASEISSCYYINNSVAFLEEDADAGIFVNAITKELGKKISFNEFHSDKLSKIRNYMAYNYTKQIQRR